MIKKLWLVAWLAWRYRAAAHCGVHGFIAKVSILGIALGVAALLIGLSAMNGFDIALQQRILSLVAQGEVVAVHGSLAGWQEVANRLVTTPGIVATAPYVESVALVEKGTTFKAVQIRGIAVAHEATVTRLPQQVTPITAWQAFECTESSIILGSGIAAALAVQPGEWITLILPPSRALRGWHQPKRVPLQVVGIAAVGSQLDQSLALVPLAALQGYLGMGTTCVSGITLKVDQPFSAEAILRQVALRHRDLTQLHFQSWKDRYGHLYRDIQLVRGMINVAMLLVMGIACFNITTTLMITAKKRQGDIAILATLGADQRLISWSFLYYGLFTGVIGGVIGLATGIGISSHLTEITRWLEQLLQYHFLPSELYFIDFLPSKVAWYDCVKVLGVTLLLSLLASWYPAYWCSKRDPVTILNQYSG